MVVVAAGGVVRDVTVGERRAGFSDVGGEEELLGGEDRKARDVYSFQEKQKQNWHKSQMGAR